MRLKEQMTYAPGTVVRDRTGALFCWVDGVWVQTSAFGPRRLRSTKDLLQPVSVVADAALETYMNNL